MTQPYIPPPPPSYPPPPPPVNVEPVPLSTTDTIPGHEGEVITESLFISTTVSVDRQSPDGGFAAAALAGVARQRDFDAVIGVRLEVASYVYGVGGPGAIAAHTAMTVLAYGTALRWNKG